MADELSKAKFEGVWGTREEWGFPRGPAAVPGALLEWLDNPRPDGDLGERILQELRRKTLVLGYNC